MVNQYLRRLSAGAFLITLGSGSALAQPSYSSLSALPGGMEGAPIIASNNPESVTREGLLLGTRQMSPSNPNTVRRILSSTSYGQGCPAGSLKEFAFYMHHLNRLGTGARYYVLLEPATPGTSVTFNAWGPAITQLDTGSLDPGFSPSYSASLALATGNLPSWVGTANGSNFVKQFSKTIWGVYALANLRANQSSSVDARIKVRAEQCLTVRVVATTAANGSVALADALGDSAYAWGNVPTQSGPGGAPCTDASNVGWGRPSGIYKYERWRGGTSVSINSANNTIGWKLLAAPPNQELSNGDCVPNPQSVVSPSSDAQRPPALGYYYTNTSGQSEGRDSDPNSTANYGAEYALNYVARNNTGQCIKASLQLRSYPGQQQCAASASSASRHYDGAVKVTRNGVAQPISRVFTKCPTGPHASTITSEIMSPGEIVDWDLQFFIPGLISIPAGLMLVSTPASCS